jgi:asparagine synthase (glutamine-hydrolysing)
LRRWPAIRCRRISIPFHPARRHAPQPFLNTFQANSVAITRWVPAAHAATAQTDDPLALIQYLDTKTYLVGDINTKVDRASMAHSLEVREPLMDHKLVEWLATCLRGSRSGQEGKYVFKKAMEPLLPQDVLYRPKMGLPYRSPAGSVGRSSSAFGMPFWGRRLPIPAFSIATIWNTSSTLTSRVRDYSAPLWTTMMFEAFLRNSNAMARCPSLPA